VDAPRVIATGVAGWSFPVYLIVQGDAFYTLWGEARGQDATGVPVFGNRCLAEEQVEQDGIEPTVVQVDSASAMKQIAATLVDAWFFYFHDCEAEMVAVKVSRVG